MNILDRYIIKKYLSTFIFSIILIISLAIVIDLTEKVENFIEKKAPLNEIIFNYYVNFIPYYTNLFMFLFIFISVIFFTSKLATNSEIIAILSSGISFNRMLRPYFLSAFILAIASFVLSSFIIPPANKIRLKFENTYVNGTYFSSSRNIHKQISPGVFIYVEYFKVKTNVGTYFSMEKFENKKLVSKLMSEEIRWNEEKKKWTIRNYSIRTIKADSEKLEKGVSIDTAINLSPDDFKQRDTDKTTMDYFELSNFIEEKKMRGETNTSSYILEKHQRWAFPFSTFILTIIGVSLSSRKKRSGTGVNIGIGIALSFIYLFFMQISAQFSIKGNMSPMLSAWFPNIVFSIAAVFLYRIAPK